MGSQLSGKVHLIDFVYDFYIKNFGVVNISEKKLIVFLISIRRHLTIPRINLFARMIGLIPDDLILLEEMIFYLKSIFFILKKNCTKEKLKSIWRTGEKKGRIVLKNAKLNNFFFKLESKMSKKLVSSLKKTIEKETKKSGKDFLFDLDNVIKSSILFRRSAVTPLPFHIQIFNTISTLSNEVIYPSVFFLMCKHFFTQKVDKSFDILSIQINKPLTLEKYQNLLVKIIKEKIIDIDGILSRKMSFISNRRSIVSNQNNLIGSDSSQKNGKNYEKSNELYNSMETDFFKGNKYFEQFFNLDKIRRAKLTREGVELKVYFQEHSYEIKNDLIKYYRKLNFSTSLYNKALRFLFSKMAKKFDEYTFDNISEFFIGYYLIKKEINVN